MKNHLCIVHERVPMLFQSVSGACELVASGSTPTPTINDPTARTYYVDIAVDPVVASPLRARERESVDTDELSRGRFKIHVRSPRASETRVAPLASSIARCFD